MGKTDIRTNRVPFVIPPTLPSTLHLTFHPPTFPFIHPPPLPSPPDATHPQPSLHPPGGTVAPCADPDGWVAGQQEWGACPRSKGPRASHGRTGADSRGGLAWRTFLFEPQLSPPHTGGHHPTPGPSRKRGAGWPWVRCQSEPQPHPVNISEAFRGCEHISRV